MSAAATSFFFVSFLAQRPVPDEVNVNLYIYRSVLLRHPYLRTSKRTLIEC